MCYQSNLGDVGVSTNNIYISVQKYETRRSSFTVPQLSCDEYPKGCNWNGNLCVMFIWWFSAMVSDVPLIRSQNVKNKYRGTTLQKLCLIYCSNVLLLFWFYEVCHVAGYYMEFYARILWRWLYLIHTIMELFQNSIRSLLVLNVNCIIIRIVAEFY